MMADAHERLDVNLKLLIRLEEDFMTRKHIDV
jgi:hypothetical protein